jgi:NitT/TauT family transport system substrate-binding protein
LAAAVSLILVGAAQAEPLRIFYAIWVGYGPFFVAAEKGFFAKENVAVELIRFDDHTAAFSGLFAGQASRSRSCAVACSSSTWPSC